MSLPDSLERSYRRLLLAYPRHYRHERGLEMLTTLLDAAAPGQSRPTRHDVRDIVLGGLRCRLRLPRGFGVRVVATLAALAGASILAATIGMLSAVATPSATEAEAAAAARLATGIDPVNLPGPAQECDTTCPITAPAAGDEVVSYHRPLTENIGRASSTETAVPLADEVNIAYQRVVTEPAARMRERLAAEGWTVGQLEASNDGHESFWAGGGDLAVFLMVAPDRNTSGDPGAGPSGPTVFLTVTRTLPSWAIVLIAASVPVGLAIGWSTVGAIVRRLRRHHPAVRVLAVTVSVPLLLAVALIQLMVLIYIGFSIYEGGISARIAFIPTTLVWRFAGMRLLPSVVGFAFAALLLLLALPVRADRQRPSTITPGEA